MSGKRNNKWGTSAEFRERERAYKEAQRCAIDDAAATSTQLAEWNDMNVAAKGLQDVTLDWDGTIMAAPLEWETRGHGNLPPDIFSDWVAQRSQELEFCSTRPLRQVFSSTERGHTIILAFSEHSIYDNSTVGEYVAANPTKTKVYYAGDVAPRSWIPNFESIDASLLKSLDRPFWTRYLPERDGYLVNIEDWEPKDEGMRFDEGYGQVVLETHHEATMRLNDWGVDALIKQRRERWNAKFEKVIKARQVKAERAKHTQQMIEAQDVDAGAPQKHETTNGKCCQRAAYQITPADKSRDVDAIWELYNEHVSLNFAAKDVAYVDKSTIEWRMEVCNTDGLPFLVLRDPWPSDETPGRAIGFVSCTRVRGVEDYTVEVEVFSDLRHLRKGVATALLTEANKLVDEKSRYYRGSGQSRKAVQRMLIHLRFAASEKPYKVFDWLWQKGYDECVEESLGRRGEHSIKQTTFTRKVW